jgi:hypothetical protein
MHTHARNGGVGGAAKDVAEHASAIARLELELAAAELKQKASTLGTGIGLLGGALVLAVFMLGFAFAAAAAGIALAVPWWVSLLIVTGALALLAAILGLIGVRLLKKATPPVPEQTIEEARMTTAALRR